MGAQLRQKALKKGLDPDALVGNHPPKSACTPNMNAEPTPEPMMTGKKCTRVASQMKDYQSSTKSGRKHDEWMKRPSRSFPSGSESALARRLVTQNPLKMVKREPRMPLKSPKKRKKKKRRRKRRKRKTNKYFSQNPRN